MAFSTIRPSVAAIIVGLTAAALSPVWRAPLPGQTPRAAGAPAAVLRYPNTLRGTQGDDLNGIHVADPYRWLENVTSPSVQAWLTAQNAFTESYLAQVPGRSSIRDQVRSAWSYPKIGAPFPGGDRLFFFENSGIEDGAVLYVQDRPDVSPRVLLDPSTMSKDGSVTIVDQAASPDGRYLAYAVSTKGSPWRSVRIRDVRTSQDLPDRIEGIKGGQIAWTRDERGFFYVRTEQPRSGTANPLAPNGHQRVFYHRVGKPQSDDRAMYDNSEHPDWRLRASVSDDGQYLIIALRPGTEPHNRLYFIDLDNPKRPDLAAPLVKLFDADDALYDFVSNEGPIFLIRTSNSAPRYRLVAVDINIPDPNRWTPIIRETYDPLVSVWRVDDRLVAHRLHDAHSSLELYALDGGARGTVPLPGVGTVTDLRVHSDAREFYFNFESFVQPPSTYRYDLETRNVMPYREQRADDFTARYETTQLFFTSKDGTRVPMFITARRGLTLDAAQPTLLSAIGSLNESATPTFSPEIAVWLELGGIYAVANVRGGGEYGRAWHEAATGQRKQKAVDDFVAAAEFLITQRYTRSKSLGVLAQGFGGLVAGAAATERPDLFGAIAIDGGLFDMARFSRFTDGADWVAEFGSPDRHDDLQALLGYSPLQNVKTGTAYPATLLTARERDDRIVAPHSYKFAASLQAAQTSANPVLLRVDFDAGDASRSTAIRQITADADRLTFLTQALHVAPR